MDTNELFGKEKISKVLLKIAPPVMLAQLIQALYNIVDSLFVGNYSDSGLTALSIIYPIQLLMIALAVGTGVGINTVMAAKLGAGNRGEAEEHAGVGTPLAVAAWVIFAAVCWAIMPAYARLQTDTPEVIADVVTYGRIVCVFSFGLFLESIWTKVHQAEGNMRRPMAAQIAGAVTNIILDPLLIFGMFGLPEMGIAGAACATVAGQIVAALVVMKKGFRKPPELRKFPRCIAAIYRLGTPNILMQAAYTVYIFGRVLDGCGDNQPLTRTGHCHIENAHFLFERLSAYVGGCRTAQNVVASHKTAAVREARGNADHGIEHETFRGILRFQLRTAAAEKADRKFKPLRGVDAHYADGILSFILRGRYRRRVGYQAVGVAEKLKKRAESALSGAHGKGV